jgi:hypothetical protein
MTTPSKYVGIPGDECQCGRRATIRHCPLCGSSRVYARSNRLHQMLDGTKKFVEVEFRCQACGHLFIEEEREFCEAPPVSAVLAKQKIQAIHEASKTGEYLNPIEAKIAVEINKLLKSPTHSEEMRQKLITQLRGAYSDMVLTESARLNITPEEIRSKESMDSFVNRHLAELEQQIETLHAPVQTDDEAPANVISEQAIRKEWVLLKFKGRIPCPIEEYVERRLKGEVFS